MRELAGETRGGTETAQLPLPGEMARLGNVSTENRP